MRFAGIWRCRKGTPASIQIIISNTIKMSEANKLIAKRIIEEIFNKSDFTSLDELISEDITIHDTDKELLGLGQLRQGVVNLHIAFPDLHYVIEDLLQDNDKITLRCTGSGTHGGIFRGV